MALTHTSLSLPPTQSSDSVGEELEAEFPGNIPPSETVLVGSECPLPPGRGERGISRDGPFWNRKGHICEVKFSVTGKLRE